MADSENSRTVPAITYGNVISETERLLEETASRRGRADVIDVDNSLVKWQAWWRAHREHLRLCYAQQSLETELFRITEGRQVDIRLPSQADVVVVTTLEEIGAAPEGGDDSQGLLAMSEAQVVARDTKLKSAEERYGLAKEREDVAAATEHHLAKELWGTSSGSAISVAAKLHSIIKQGEPEINSSEFPWPQIRSALIDVLMTHTSGI